MQGLLASVNSLNMQQIPLLNSLFECGGVQYSHSSQYLVSLYCIYSSRGNVIE